MKIKGGPRLMTMQNECDTATDLDEITAPTLEQSKSSNDITVRYFT